MQISNENRRQILAYLSIAVVTIASILAYTIESWRWGAAAVGIGFVLIGLLLFLSSKNSADG